MSLWDASSDQDSKWNHLKDESRDKNNEQLRLYIKRRVGECGVTYRSDFTQFSRLVFTYYAASAVALGAKDTLDGEMRTKLLGLSSQSFRYLTCAFQVCHILNKLLVNPNADDCLMELLRASCNMSGIDGLSMDRYISDWMLCFSGLEGDDKEARTFLMARLGQKRYEYIAPILGLPMDSKSAVFQGFFWEPISMGIAATTTYLLNSQEWQANLDKLIPI